MEFIEVSAKTVDDAITEASIKLGTTSDKIEVEVIEKGSTGLVSRVNVQSSRHGRRMIR